jgi:ABC-type branched-subunit amino acid transport system ATPase component
VHRDEQPIILLGEHDLVTLRQLTDRHYVIDAGLRIATGPTAHVLADPAVRRAYQGQPSAGGLAR